MGLGVAPIPVTVGLGSGGKKAISVLPGDNINELVRMKMDTPQVKF